MARSHQLCVPTLMEMFCGPRLPFKPLPVQGTAPPCKSDSTLRAVSCLDHLEHREARAAAAAESSGHVAWGSTNAFLLPSVRRQD